MQAQAERMIEMTLVELQNKLGEQIDLLTDKDTPHSAKRNLAEIAADGFQLGKQMINNADVVLRTEKLEAEGEIKRF